MAGNLSLLTDTDDADDCAFISDIGRAIDSADLICRDDEVLGLAVTTRKLVEAPLNDLVAIEDDGRPK